LRYKPLTAEEKEDRVDLSRKSLRLHFRQACTKFARKLCCAVRKGLQFGRRYMLATTLRVEARRTRLLGGFSMALNSPRARDVDPTPPCTVTFAAYFQ
jgi:hypothetical protein